ncbi:16506_t:CDS:1, partial [Gigaspora rosea]
VVKVVSRVVAKLVAKIGVGVVGKVVELVANIIAGVVVEVVAKGIVEFVAEVDIANVDVDDSTVSVGLSLYHLVTAFLFRSSLSDFCFSVSTIGGD